MKKLFAVLVSLIPAIYAAGMVLFLFIMPEDEVLFTVLGGIVLLSIVFCTVHSILSTKADRKFLALSNVWSVGGNLLLVIAEFVWLIVSYIQVRIAEQNGGMEGGLGIVLLIVFFMPHWISYLICRLTAAIGCERALHGMIGNGWKTFLTLCHIIPVLDLICAIVVLHKVKRFHSCQQPPIEIE